tara:strand:+ start:486 stop:1058 length:573 start_codon:yes stop_codon:yes gene_type:complete
MKRLIKFIIKDFLNIYDYFRIASTKVIKIKKKLKFVDNTFYIHRPTFRISKDFKTGKYGLMGYNCNICSGVSFGNYVLLAPEVHFVGNDHDFSNPSLPIIFSGRPLLEKKTFVDDDVWIGRGVIVMAGVTIGKGSIIAAGAIVTKDVEPLSVYAGIPARKIRPRFQNKHEENIYLDFIRNKPKKWGDYVT